MQTDVFEVHLDDDNSSKEVWRSIFAKQFGLHCQFDQSEFIGSSLRSWSLGDLLLVDAKLSHAVLWPIEHQGAADVLLKIVGAGRVTIEQRERVWNFDSGAMLLVDTGCPYKQTIVEATRLIIVRIPRHRLRERGFEHSLRGLTSPDITLADVQALRDLIFNIAKQNASTSTAVRCRQGNQLLDLIDVVIEDPSAFGRSRSSEATLFRAKRYIERNLRNADLNAAAIASAVWTSHVHLNRLFRTDGTTLMRYVWDRRLEVAAQLISISGESRLKVHEIALRCGFSTHAHFSRVFKKRYGVSPREALVARSIVFNGDKNREGGEEEL
ncbi:hypothetical protein GCM10027093_31670 [Paraburkholderia jirisanensis]